jgi:hypothetical protein
MRSLSRRSEAEAGNSIIQPKNDRDKVLLISLFIENKSFLLSHFPENPSKTNDQVENDNRCYQINKHLFSHSFQVLLFNFFINAIPLKRENSP